MPGILLLTGMSCIITSCNLVFPYSASTADRSGPPDTGNSTTPDVRRDAASDASWLAGYRYRSRLELHVASGTTATDYQVHFVVTSTALPHFPIAQACRDVRFTANTQTLSYWVESCTAGSASIWVKVPFFLSTNKSYVDMYYGNSAAPNGSNGEATFELFDDFSSGAKPNTLKWESGCFLNYNASNAKVIVDQGKLKIVADATSFGQPSVCQSRSVMELDISKGYLLQYRADPYQSSSEGQRWRSGFFLSTRDQVYEDAPAGVIPVQGGFPRPTQSLYILQSQCETHNPAEGEPCAVPGLCIDACGGSSCNDPAGHPTPVPATWVSPLLFYSYDYTHGAYTSFGGSYVFRVTVDGTNVSVSYRDPASLAYKQLVNQKPHLQTKMLKKIYFARAADQDIVSTQTFDDVLVAKYHSPEPEVVIGPEEDSL
jgi:hypothetical protein